MTTTETTEAVKAPPWHKQHFVAFDTETTAADPETARLVTADFIQLDPITSTVVSTRNYLADPGIDIPAEAAEIHGITTEHAREHGQPVADVVLQIANDLETTWNAGLPVVAYNAAYDLTVIDRELRRHHGRQLRITGPVLDPYVIDRACDRFRKGKRKLGMVCEHYGVTLDNAHNSAADAEAAGRLMVALAKKFPVKVARRDLRSLWTAQRAWHREWAAGFQTWMRDQIKADADREWWNANGHKAECLYTPSEEDTQPEPDAPKPEPCTCGDAPDGSGDAAAAEVHIDGTWPMRPHTAESEAA